MRALGYIRVSTEEQQRSGHSLDMQPDLIRQWCTLFGHQLVDIVEDRGVSAGKALAKRPGGAELLDRLRQGEADLVIVFRLDRLFRNALHGLDFIRGELDTIGVSLQSITEKVDTTTATGRLCLTLLLGVAEYERDTTRERNRATTDSLRDRGRVYGTTPYGCVALNGQWSDDKGRVVGQELFRDAVHWPHRELIVALRQPDADGKRLSLAEISTELQRRGIKAPSGAARWGKQSINRVINSHGGLKHIPALPTDHEPAVSEAAHP
ncbi:MAG: recombinase family protein [Pseudoxanthomonas sp.]